MQAAVKLEQAPQPQPYNPPQAPPIPAYQQQPVPAYQQRGGNTGSKIAVVGFLLIFIVLGLVFVLIFVLRTSQSGAIPNIPQITTELKQRINPPNIVAIDWKGERKITLLDVYALSSLTLHNSGGSGYVLVEYYAEKSGVLIRKTYFLAGGETQTFSEKLDIKINDGWVNFRIVDQHAS